MVFTVFFVCSAFLSAQTLDQAISGAALSISRDLPAGSTAAVIGFHSDFKNLNEYVINELQGAILRNRRVTPIGLDQGQLESIRSELDLNMAGGGNEESARNIGRLLGVQYLIAGSIESFNSRYRINFYAVDTAAKLQSQYEDFLNPQNDQRLATLMGVTIISSSQSRDNQSGDAWKNKWVYLGGFLAAGGGTSEGDSAFIFGIGAVVDAALLPFFSIELNLALGISGFGVVLPVIPILAKLGGRFGKLELSFDIGATIGLGFTLGATLGFKAGPGILYTKVVGVPSGTNLDSAILGVIGYKVGLGNKRK